ncbi:hypothetical protein AGRA3207_007540 [Actinomadura graeca]|uniref:DUF2637 domain-containing protein n=1 Tax=Actinomadura graeca TaxID=2750812 RepID=A0ABX8R6C5_9ACTN|nr:hypothetical protein [Actinomadura graeca]QXJ25969.1 hypothetical protein AGRA3207_007540 [Actinomadura graeca]
MAEPDGGSWILVLCGAAGAGVVAVLAVAFWASGRRVRRRALRQGVPPEPKPPVRAGGTSGGDLAAAAIATAVSAEGMWETFSALAMPVWLRAGTFAFIELMTIQCVRRARQSMHAGFGPGGDGVAMWVLTAVSAVLSVSHEVTSAHPNTAVILVRLTAPPVAAWGWERNMRLQRRRRSGRRIHWRVTAERIAVGLGLASGAGSAAGQDEAHRHRTRVVRAGLRLRNLQQTGAWGWRARRARTRLEKAVARATERTPLAHDPRMLRQLMAELGAVYHAAGLAELAISAPWSPDPVPAPAGRAGTGAHTKVCTPRPPARVRAVPAAPLRSPPGADGVTAVRYHRALVLGHGGRSSASTPRPAGEVRRRHHRPRPGATTGSASGASNTGGVTATSPAATAASTAGDAASNGRQNPPAGGNTVAAASSGADNGSDPGGQGRHRQHRRASADTGSPQRRHRPRAGSPAGRTRPRRPIEEWVELAGPVFEAEMARLRRQPTGAEFAGAIAAAGLGEVSASTAKTIRARIRATAELTR